MKGYFGGSREQGVLRLLSMHKEETFVKKINVAAP